MGNLKSIKTTVFGIVGALGVILTQIGYFFDDDKNTETDTQIVHTQWQDVVRLGGGLLTVFGIGGVGVTARDDDVTSEGNKAPKDTTP